MAAIALRNGLNANMVYRWLREEAQGVEDGGHFIDVQIPAPAMASPEIRVDLRCGAATVTVNWPMEGGRECAAWLREWLQ
ncbi:MAG: IS66 family insertion sequence element accessory protein TnpB [Burkholderiaceae bacterium]|nr:IS66 family insertion sequence element accessory protein TnpB [Burkholderiaceae bacterium]